MTEHNNEWFSNWQEINKLQDDTIRELKEKIRLMKLQLMRSQIEKLKLENKELIEQLNIPQE